MRYNEYNIEIICVADSGRSEDCHEKYYQKYLMRNGGCYKNTGVKSATLYDDDTFSGSDEIDENGVVDGNILAVETESGTMHYYVIKDTAGESSAELKLFYNNTEIPQGTTSFAAGTYTLNAVINNTNDTAEDYLAILALKKDGKLVSVKFVDQKVEGETTIPVKMDVADADGVTFEAYLWNTFGNMNVQTDSIAW